MWWPKCFISLLEAVKASGPQPFHDLCTGQLQPMRVMLFVMRNLNREQQWGMTGMCFHWKELYARKRERKKTQEEKLEARCVQKEPSLGPKRKTNVIVHWLSLCQPSLTNWFLVSLPASPRLPHCVSVSRVCLLRWTVTHFWMSPSRPLGCVIESVSGGNHAENWKL